MLWSTIKMNNREIIEISYECRMSHTLLINNVFLFFSMSSPVLLFNIFLKLPSQLFVGFQSFSSKAEAGIKEQGPWSVRFCSPTLGCPGFDSSCFPLKTSVPKCWNLLESVLLRNYAFRGETATSVYSCLISKWELSLNKGPWSQFYWSKYINLTHAYCKLPMITMATFIHIQDHMSSYMFSHIDQNRILSSFFSFCQSDWWHRASSSNH